MSALSTLMYTLATKFIVGKASGAAGGAGGAGMGGVAVGSGVVKDACTILARCNNVVAKTALAALQKV